MEIIKTAYGSARHFLYPMYCYGCYALIDEAQNLCSVCTASIKPISSLTVQLTAAQQLKVYAVAGYQEPLRKIILKKHNADYFASKLLARLINEHLNLSYIQADVLVPVPVHWSRFARRGFNPSEVMAHELGKLLGLPVVDVLVRKKRTEYQSTLDGDGRLENVKDAFELKAGYAPIIGHKKLLLVDDLYTSGATMISCAKTLLNGRPASITGVVASRAG